MMTPDPRLCWGLRRLPNHSSSPPKNWLKNGSLANGEFEVRTIDTDEMLTIPPRARAATALKSGRAATGAAGCAAAAGARRAAWSAGAATESEALRNRPVSTRPNAKPANTRTSAKRVRLSMGLG